MKAQIKGKLTAKIGDMWDCLAIFVGWGTCIAIGSWLLPARITMLRAGDFTMVTVFGIGLGAALLATSGVGIYVILRENGKAYKKAARGAKLI